MSREAVNYSIKSTVDDTIHAFLSESLSNRNLGNGKNNGGRLFRFIGGVYYEVERGFKINSIPLAHRRIYHLWKNIFTAVNPNFKTGLTTANDVRAFFADDKGFFINPDSIDLSDSPFVLVLELMRLASHELTHSGGYLRHNEEFTSAQKEFFTDITRANEKQFNKLVKNAKKLLDDSNKGIN